MKRNLLSLMVVVFCLGAMMLSGCKDSDNIGGNYKTFDGETIKDYMDNHPEFSEFEQALDQVHALSLLSSYGKYTCFLPDNDAVNDYIKRNGFDSFEAFLDSTDAVKNMVYYHLIDGESHGADVYTTAYFKIGNIETKNMLGRYLYTTVTPDGASWLINNNSKIIGTNNMMVNGVIHLVDRVVEGNNELVSDYIMKDPQFSIYTQALKATGLIDSLSLVEDESYVQVASTEPSAPTPAKRLYGYTALLEPNTVLQKNGINTLADMRKYAEEKYPDGKGLPDTDRQSSLNMFVAYHLIPYKLTSSQLCPTRGLTVTRTFYDIAWQTETFRDGKYSLDSYLFPMAPNTLINVQEFIWRDQDAQAPIFNDPRNPYAPQYNNLVSEADDVVTINIGNSNIDCLNGIVHSLTNMLYFRDDIYHKRIRMDFTLFFPEMWNNDIRSHAATIPYGYLSNLKYENTDDKWVRYWLEYGGHSYYLGDNYKVWGRGNFDITIGPIPSGSYEVRIGYHVGVYDCGVVQYYLDGEPCGIPLDQTISAAKSTEIGWNQTWFYLYGGVEQTPIFAWLSGRETADDYYGYDNDKAMHNLGYMKAPDCYTARELANGNFEPIHAGTARNDAYSVRRVLKMVTWDKTDKHTFTISNLMDKGFDLDYIEFMPKDMIENEDTH